MKLLVLQETDWIKRGPHQQHHLMDRMALKGHEIRVIDHESLWRYDDGRIGVGISEDVIPWRMFDVRPDAVDDNVVYGRDFYELYRDHITFDVQVDQ